MACIKHGWRSAVVGVMFLAGCVGLGDMRLETVAAKQPPQPPDDIPIVPVPPPPFARPAASGRSKPPDSQTASGGSKTPDSSHQGANAPRSPIPSQADDARTTSTHSARQLLEQAAARCGDLDSYIVRLTRRESLKGKLGPEEIIAFSFRKQPFSVHFKWLGKTAKGREVVYVKDRYGNKIHTKVAAGDSLLLPAGAHLALSPDNPLVRSASRHPITDAGICHCVESLVALLDAQERGDSRQGTLNVLPPQRRPEYPQPVETMERRIPPGIEPDLPRGGRRLMYFDPDSHLPMLVITYDDKGNEVEYYHYDRLINPVNLDDDDFNPDKLWPVSDASQKRP